MTVNSERIRNSQEDHPGGGGRAEVAAQMSTKEKLESRFDQSYASRLCEYITGLPVDSPEIAERLVADHYAIRGKYGLPPRVARIDDPNWYENFLNEIADREDVEVVGKTSCGDFFDIYPKASAVFLDDQGRAGVDMDRTTDDAYSDSLGKLEHELIHALQHKQTPSMPIEAMEYEAYIAGGKVEMLSDPDIREMVFGVLIGASVAHSYDEKSKKSGRQIAPDWSSAEYFIEHIDGIAVDVLPEEDRRLFEELKQKELDAIEARVRMLES